MNATDTFLSALMFWAFGAAVVVAIGTVVWAGLYALVSIPLALIGL